MTEVPDTMFADLIRIADADYGFAINPHRFAVTGRCASQRARHQKEAADPPNR